MLSLDPEEFSRFMVLSEINYIAEEKIDLI